MEYGGEAQGLLAALNADGNVDLNYIMFVPATISQEPVEVELMIAADGTQVTLSWEGDGGVLQTSASVNGPWSNVNVTGNSHTVSADQSEAFFRVVAP